MDAPSQQIKCKPTYKKSAYSHIVTEHEKHPCSFCGKIISYKKMPEHIKRLHTSDADKPFQCKFCGKGFLLETHVLDHENIHTGQKPHMCSFCGKSFANVSNQRMHERTTHLGHKRKYSKNCPNT